MGIFDFIKGAGSKEIESHTSSPSPDPAFVNKAITETFAKVLDKYELKVEDLKLDYDGGKVTVSGMAADCTTREKVVLALGNMRGISQVDDQMIVAEQEEEEAPEAQFYTVVSGDTLGKIAKSFYGNAMKYPVIFEANRPMLKDPNLIYPGQVLRIPPVED